MSILTSALELPEPTKPSAAARGTSIEDPAKAPQGLKLLERPQAQARTQAPVEGKANSRATYATASKMFTTDNPPKYNGPINGRDRRMKKPVDFMLPDDEEDAENYEAMLQYLSIYSVEDHQKTLSMVYACPNCEVRIANEDDMVTRPFIWSAEELSLNAVFKKTSNLVACGKDVCCYRCRAKLFDYCAEDPFLLTVPMFQANNKQTLLKRAYRMLSLTFTSGYALLGTGIERELKQSKYLTRINNQDYVNILRSISEKTEQLDKALLVERTNLVTFAREKSPFKTVKNLKLEAKLLRELPKLHQHSEFIFWETLHQHRDMKGSKVFDSAVFFRVGNDGREFITHTDLHERFTEKIHLLLWLATGGNFLFADWGSYDTAGGPQKASDSVDMAREAKQWDFDMVDTNKQPALAKLIRDGHFLGRWGFGKRKEDSPDYEKIFEPTEEMWKKISEALHGDLLYPNWLFLHDYPGSIFIEKKRTRDKTPYSREALDAIKPRALVGMKQHRSSGGSRCSKWLETLGMQE